MANSRPIWDGKCKFTMVVGLPGSGKTTLAVETWGRDDDTMIADDFNKNSKLYLDAFKEEIPFGGFKHVVITDPALCGVPEGSAEATVCEMFHLEAQNVVFEWIYFENDMEAALVNAARTPKPGGTDAYTRTLTKHYTIPPGAKVLPVYKSIN